MILLSKIAFQYIVVQIIKIVMSVLLDIIHQNVSHVRKIVQNALLNQFVKNVFMDTIYTILLVLMLLQDVMLVLKDN